jgi:hypothetical protein
MISSDAPQAGDASARDHDYLKTTKLYQTMVDEIGEESADRLTGGVS